MVEVFSGVGVEGSSSPSQAAAVNANAVARMTATIRLFSSAIRRVYPPSALAKPPLSPPLFIPLSQCVQW